jgi:hypothetical protein
MTTKRTPIGRQSRAITPEMVALFKKIRRLYRGFHVSPSDELVDAHNDLHGLLGLHSVHPSPALAPASVPAGLNSFVAQCYRESIALCQEIETAIAAERRQARQQRKLRASA